MSVAGRLIRPWLGRKALQGAFEACLELGVRGMNLQADPTVEDSGERRVLETLARSGARDGGTVVVLDVGANAGDWSLAADRALERAGRARRIVSFEPSAETFERLSRSVSGIASIEPVRLAFGEAPGELVLHSDAAGSGLASPYARKLDTHGIRLDREERVPVATLDAFCRERGTARIDLLKLDVEGHELRVLEGAAALLAAGAIDRVQFEFGATHIDARVFLRDFYELLGAEWAIHRVLRDGLRPLGTYREINEIFLSANYLAVRSGVDPRPS